MADPNHLLSKSHKADTLEDMIEQCNEKLSWTQFFQGFLVSLVAFFDAQQTFISIFTDTQPKWTCTNTPCNITTNICQLPTNSWSWDFSKQTSIISEWSLECAGPILTGLPASSFFLGCAVGSLGLVLIGDSALGRKNMLVITTLLMSITGVLTSFSVNLWMYAMLRFVSGIGRGGVATYNLVLCTELIGKKWRSHIGVLGFIFFDLGFLSLPFVAYLLKGYSWRLIYLSVCIPSVIHSILVCFLVCESPRWLFINGRKQEFVETMKKIVAPTNQSRLTQSFFENCNDLVEKSQENVNTFSTMKILISTKWALKRLCISMAVGLGIGMVYYGMPLGIGNLSFDPYISVALNALAEFPSSPMTFFVIGKLDRAVSVFGFGLLSGICSVACVVVKSKGVQMVLELVSFFGACTAFDVFLIYTVELFPTCVRSTAVNMIREALVFGGVFGPVIAATGRENGLLSFGVFGVAISVCGLLVMWLPETKGRMLCDTLEEEEQKIAGVLDNAVWFSNKKMSCV